MLDIACIELHSSMGLYTILRKTNHILIELVKHLCDILDPILGESSYTLALPEQDFGFLHNVILM